MSKRVAISLCTCRRPEQLRRALNAIARQDYAGEIRVVVMENHSEREGTHVCTEMARDYPFVLEHGYEAKPGLTHARNALLRLALAGPCDFIAMLDDDEWPDPDWLTRLMAAQEATGADIVGGRMVPVFETKPDDWIERCSYFGYSGDSYSTGNLLLRADMLRAQDYWFDPQLNFVGSEDRELMERLRAKGFSASPCDDAIVREWVPASRARLGYVLARSMRIGNSDVRVERMSGRPMRQQIAPTFMKLVYALNHLFWSPFQTWRIYRVLDDLATFWGMFLGLMDYRYQFYAEQHGHARRWARDDDSGVRG